MCCLGNFITKVQRGRPKQKNEKNRTNTQGLKITEEKVLPL